MREFLLVIFTYLILCKANSQELSAKDFLFSSSFSPKKFESYLSKKKFLLTGSRLRRDTLVNVYCLKPGKKNDQPDSVKRNVETYQTKDNFSFTFFTSSEKEF